MENNYSFDKKVYIKTQNTEAVARRCSVIAFFLEILQNSQETPVLESLFY